jgi:hypothetical protein
MLLASSRRRIDVLLTDASASYATPLQLIAVRAAHGPPWPRRPAGIPSRMWLLAYRPIEPGDHNCGPPLIQDLESFAISGCFG